MKAKGTVHKFGDNVDTDVIIPARYLNKSTPNGMGTVKKSILGFIAGGYEYGRYDPRY